MLKNMKEPYKLTDGDYNVLNSMCNYCCDINECKKSFCKKKKLALFVMSHKKEFRKARYKGFIIDDTKFTNIKTNLIGEIEMDEPSKG